MNYNIPKKIRELQFLNGSAFFTKNYNIPKKIRELQLKTGTGCYGVIITYQKN